MKIKTNGQAAWIKALMADYAQGAKAVHAILNP
jgi:hypothetical protein